MWDRKLTALRDVLVALFPDRRDARGIADQAGLPSAQLDLDGSPINFWHEILRKAHPRGLIPGIIKAARSHEPANEWLALAENDDLSPVKGPEADEPHWHGPKEADSLEKITGDQSTLLPISFLEAGLKASRAVARIVREDGGVGTGFLIADNVLVTNNHVLPDAETAAAARIQFNYQKTRDGLDLPFETYEADPAQGFATSPLKGGDDWTAVRVAADVNAAWGSLTLACRATALGHHVNIIQHPGGGPKQIALYHNTVASVGEGRVQYLTDTLPGSSGSPVFNDDWEVVAVHHSGGWLHEPSVAEGAKRGKRPKFYRNEGIEIARVVDGLRQAGLV